VIAAGLAIGLAAADTKIVEQHHSDAFEVMGQKQPATDQEVTTWLTSKKMRSDRGDTSFIARLDEQKFYIINHSNKKVLEADLPVTIESIAGEMAAMIKPMMEKMRITAQVTPSEERKTIKEWPARRYDIKADSEMMDMNIEMWVTKDVPGDPQAAMDMASVLYGLQPGMKDLVEEIKKIDGYPIKQITTIKVMGATQKSTQEVVSIEEMDAPSGTYDPPADYTVKPLTLQEMQQLGQ
jgi:hypothetical protein